MNSNNGNKLFMHRIIKLISPITCQTFKVELNGEEEEMKELLGTILEINPKSIKGLRDSFNNYYTISSAVKNPLLNTDPYNYYTVVIKQSNDIKYMKYPSLNLSNHDQISNGRINYEKNYENKTMNYLDNDDNNFYQQNNDNDNYKTKDLLKLVKELYKRDYIDRNLKKKLKKLIKENNPEIIYILKTFLNSKKNYYELAKKIKPVLSSSSSNSDNEEDSKYNSSSNNSSRSNSKKKHKQKSHHKDKGKDNNNKSNKKENMTKEEKILNDLNKNFEKEQFSILKDLIKKKNPEIIKYIKKFEKDNDYNHLVSKLNIISRAYQENSPKENSSESSNESSEDSDDESDVKKNDSSDYAKQGNKKQKKDKNNHKEIDIKNITKKIYSAMKKLRKDLFYFAKYDLDKMKTEEKITLFKKKFKLNLDKINSENNYKIPKKNISKIEKYYTQYMLKKVFNNFNEDEKSIYEILCENEEKSEVDQIYKELLKNRDLKEFETQMKKLIEKEDKIDVEEGEDEIKEINEDEEEEDDEGEEDEENEGDENDDDPDKKEESSSNNFILNNGDKDATTRMLNNNYMKNLINHNQSASKNKSKENSVDKSENEEKKNNEEGNNNMGLDFVLVKPKKMNNKEEERKGQESVDENDKNNNYNFNMYQNKDKENSISTSTHKKMNVFISQIEHIKKIDDIKKPIIEAIYQNNKYIMELYEKFQKNKSILNKKSLYVVYKKIQENPEINVNNTKSNKEDKNSAEFQSLIQNNDKLDETQKEFICYDFNNNKDSKFIGVFNEYKQLNDIDEFYETIDLYLTKNKNNNELFVKFCLKKIKDSGNNDILENSKKFINNIKKSGFFSEQDCKIIETYLDKDDMVFIGIFRELFKTENFNEFMENMNLALANKKKEGNDKSKWDSDIINKNYEELKKNLDEKLWNGLEKFYRKKSEKLYDILQNLNNKNLKSKIESARILILTKELSPK